MLTNPDEFKIQVTKGSGPGGQHKNKVESCVTVIHTPTGVSETCQETRSKFKNTELAKSRVIRRVLNLKQQEENKRKNEIRKSLINTKTVRTYNYARNQVKDHTTGKTASLKEIMNGKIELLHP